MREPACHYFPDPNRPTVQPSKLIGLKVLLFVMTVAGGAAAVIILFSYLVIFAYFINKLF